MSQLRDVLAEHGPNRIALGGHFNTTEFKSSLEKVHSDLRKYYLATGAMIGLVFVVELIAAVIYIREPAVLTGLGLAVGVTIAGGIANMIKLAREMAQISLLVALCGNLSDAGVANIAEVLAKNLPHK